jgi:hypothetical protein
MKKGLQRLAFSFEGDTLTHYGGLFLIQRFCNKLDLRGRLSRCFSAAPAWQEFDPVDVVLMLLFLLIAGVQRIHRSDQLQYDGFFRSLLGLPRLPEEGALRRVLKRLCPEAIRQLVRLHDALRQELFAIPRPRNWLTFHLDSVVLTVWGKHQGARLGYNPKARDRRSYHPIRCFEDHGQEFWHGSLRPGDAGSNTGARFFVQRCLDKVPSHIARSRIRLLADAGFFSGVLIDVLEQAGCAYSIVCRSYEAYHRMAEQAGFRDLKLGWGVAEFRHKPQHWKREHRFIAIRRPLPVDPEESTQLTLFKDIRYSYSILVTNLEINPWKVWNDYLQRSNIERSIRERLNDLALSKIPTHTWTAHVAFFQLLLFAYNLLHWFKPLSFPQPLLGLTADTLRHQFFEVPGKLNCTAGANVFLLPRDYPHQVEFLRAVQRVTKLKKRFAR